MKPPFALVFQLALAAWAGALVFGSIALRVLVSRLDDARAYGATRLVAPVLDLFGTWMGGIAVLALVLGRRGFGLGWATAMTLVALMVTVGLYDRAVIMPSLEASWNRLSLSPEADRPRWRREWLFLLRMSAWGRWTSAAMGAAAVAIAG